MKIIDPSDMVGGDARAINEFCIPAELLMEKAGAAVASHIMSVASERGLINPSICLLAGSGNNGGDAFVAARHLHESGLDVLLLLAGQVEKMAGAARYHFGLMRRNGIRPVEWLKAVSSQAFRDRRFDFIVDGLLGTGSSGAPRGNAAEAIRYINSRSVGSIVVAIDIPSGLDASDGSVATEAVMADSTVTMCLPKKGLVLGHGVTHSGKIVVADIGIPQDITVDMHSDIELVTGGDVRALIPKRDPCSHKGVFGHLLVVGGAQGFAGAPALAAGAALRSGVGLVTVMAPAAVSGMVSMIFPEVMTRPGRDPAGKVLLASDLDTCDINDYDAILIGPGMTVCDSTEALVKRVVSESIRPVILDADAINVLSLSDDIFHNAECPLVLTPHPGEMARFAGLSVTKVQEDRLGIATEVSRNTDGSIIVLKGAGTVIAQSGRLPSINVSGNPGMATAGSGDVLSGIIGSLVAQAYEPYSASCAGVYIHGCAGDRASLRMSQQSMTAGDIIRHIGPVFLSMTGV